MARNFAAGSSQWLEFSGSTLDQTTAITISVIFKLASSGTSMVLTSFGASNIGDVINAELDIQSGGYRFVYTTGASTFVGFTTTDSFDTNWHNAVYAGDYTTAGSKIYIDGNSHSFATSGTPGTPTTGAVGARNLLGAFPQGGGTAVAFLDGILAEVAVWNAILTQGEVSSLAKGYVPALIRPASLIAYWPLIRSIAVEQVAGLSLTDHNTTTVVAHPRIINPSPRRKIMKTPTAITVPLRAQIWM